MAIIAAITAATACGLDNADPSGTGKGSHLGLRPAAPAPQPATPQTTPPSTPPSTKEICDNKIDDDGDGAVDCADSDCQREPACYASPGCNGNCSCDLIKQNCAAPTDRCWPVGPKVSDGACYPYGPKQAGDPCVEPPVDGADSCGKGLICVAKDQNGTDGRCYPLCDNKASCKANETCAQVSLGNVHSDWGICIATPPPPPPAPTPCDVLKPQCKAGEMCDLAAGGICVKAGTTAAGSPCNVSSACVSGTGCASHVGWDGLSGDYYFALDFGRAGSCEKYCSLNAANSGCASGELCGKLLDKGGNANPTVGICYSKAP
ncbi:MAG: hypothetical protein H6707_10245 [Deltaproteobacteria bacterium]|nr:hypothetical protein [Deltaproteobacteria bacterium]